MHALPQEELSNRATINICMEPLLRADIHTLTPPSILVKELGFGE